MSVQENYILKGKDGLKKKAIDNIIIPLYLAIPLSDMNINPNLKQTQGYENL